MHHNVSRKPQVRNRTSKSLYTPIFYAPSSSLAAASDGEPPTQTSAYLRELGKLHVAIAGMTEVPPSPSSSPGPLSGDDDPHDVAGDVRDAERNSRVEKLKKRVQEAYEAADGEPANGKWTLVAQLLKLPLARGRYKYFTARADGRRPPTPERGWLNTSNEDQWMAWETKRLVEHRLYSRVDGWRNEIGDGLGLDVDDEEPVSPGESKTIAFKRRSGGYSGSRHASEDVGKGKAKASPPVNAKPKPPARQSAAHDRKDPSPLGFAVVKKSSVNIATKPKSNAPNSTPKPIPEKATSPPRRPSPFTGGNPQPRSSLPSRAVEPKLPKTIAQVPEMSFFPPSFPEHLATSTPLGKADASRRKPSPIPAVPHSSPITTLPPTSQPQHQLEMRLRSAAAHPQPHPQPQPQQLQGPPKKRKSAKRPYSSSSPQPRVAKRARLTPPPEPIAAFHSTGPLPLPLTTPSVSDELYAGRGVQAPITPQTHEEVPVIAAELIPSLKIGPPSRKKIKLSMKRMPGGTAALPNPVQPLAKPPSVAKPPAITSHAKPPSITIPLIPSPISDRHQMDFIPGEYDLDLHPLHFPHDDLHLPVDIPNAFPPSPPAKSLSSLAQDDSDDESPYIHSFLDDRDPNLTRDGFNPPFASTQVTVGAGSADQQYFFNGNEDNGYGSQNHARPLIPASSGMWMPYNSQFDVDKQVDKVSKFMEEDVDIEGWLRDSKSPSPVVDEIEEDDV
ncbi:hypothetical protein BDN72DRAFT_962726 [Pluteus cervinus]|uniref:Uncharacterized protein n=1 Tax=Pluteus cervinus TaxID=181527 RepID=A0ACD3AHM5_9AGAR|nr:hypothetical protein BDN72DRAFT_962726 [Pluteus cervinus]